MEHFLIDHGYLAIVVLAFIEACCVPIPSEVTFGFAGVLAYQHHLNIFLVIIVGTLAELVGSCVSYAIGRIGGRPLVERLGKYVLVTSKDLDRAERWFDGRGEFGLAIARALPILRAFSSIIAGIADMAFAKFVLFSLLGTVVYATVLASIGYGVGSAWTTVYHDFSLAGYVILAIVLLAIAAVARHRIVELRRESKSKSKVEVR